MVAATSRKHLAFDHIEDVLLDIPPEHQHMINPVRASGGALTLASQMASPASSGGATSPPQMVYVRAIYAARGNPTKWQPWTRANHRCTHEAGRLDLPLAEARAALSRRGAPRDPGTAPLGACAPPLRSL